MSDMFMTFLVMSVQEIFIIWKGVSRPLIGFIRDACSMLQTRVMMVCSVIPALPLSAGNVMSDMFMTFLVMSGHKLSIIWKSISRPLIWFIRDACSMLQTRVMMVCSVIPTLPLSARNDMFMTFWWCPLVGPYNKSLLFERL